MWKTRNSSPYLQPGRLNDVLAAIQTMALYRYYTGNLNIRVKSCHNAVGGVLRARLVISPTSPRLARPAILP